MLNNSYEAIEGGLSAQASLLGCVGLPYHDLFGGGFRVPSGR